MSTEDPTTTKEIDWRKNCLTAGIHDGRPEELWILPLFQAAYMFDQESLQGIVLARIYNDAMQMVKYGDKELSDIPTPEWARAVRAKAEEIFPSTLTRMTQDIAEYYQSDMWKREQKTVVERIERDKLNPFYQPRHGHDSVNLLCRIVAMSAHRSVTR